MSGKRLVACVLAWCEARLPVRAFLRTHLIERTVPRRLGFGHFFGALALLALAIQVLSGIFLAVHYKPDVSLNAFGVPRAFASVEHIVRDVKAGGFLRAAHAVGASLLMLLVYLHLFRGLLLKRFRKPRELVWLLGLGFMLVLLAEAFLGWVLPWGQMSGWGARVVLNLLGTIPLAGKFLAGVLMGATELGDETLGRFFVLHAIVLPFALFGLAGLHLIASRSAGRMRLKEVDVGGGEEALVPFYPHHMVRLGRAIFLLLLALWGFALAASMGGWGAEQANLTPYDPMRTPAGIVPVWFLAPFYSMLRASTPSLFPFLWGTIVFLAWRACRGGRGWLGPCLASFMAVFFYLGFFGSSFLGLTLPGLAGEWVPALLSRGLEPRFWGLVVMLSALLPLGAMPWLAPAASGAAYRCALIGFSANFVLLGALGGGAPGKIFPAWLPVEALAQICTIIHLGFFAFLPCWGCAKFFDKNRLKRALDRG